MISNKKNIYLITISTCLGLVVFGVLVIAPYVKDIFALSDDIKKQKSGIADFDLKKDNFKKLKEDEEEAKSTLNNLSKALISKENGLEFIVLLENIAEKTSNSQTIEVINTLEESSKNKKDGNTDSKTESIRDPLESINSLRFRVKLQGSYKNLLLYLAELESVGVYTDVVSMEIKSNSASPVSGTKPFGEEELSNAEIVKTTLEIRAFTR